MHLPVRSILQFDADRVTLDLDGSSAELPFSPASLASTLLHHDPPTPNELEHAIEVIEDALMATRLPAADRGELTVRGAPATTPASASREEIETAFQSLAARALGMPPSNASAGREAAAALLILRECMQHLGFDRMQATSA
jgi:hypothetical protein